MTPAERLLAAADLLDKRASEATEGPWSADDPVLEVAGFYGYDVDGPHGGYVTRLARIQDARYIATMHPEVGKAVAAWLRFMADGGAWGMVYASPLADLVLAGEQEQEGGVEHQTITNPDAVRRCPARGYANEPCIRPDLHDGSHEWREQEQGG